MPEINPLYLFYACAAVGVVLAIEALYLLLHDTRSYRSRVNRRLALSSREGDREKVLVQLRRERGLSAEGGFAMPVRWFNRLVVQSGARVTLPRAALVITGVALAVFVGLMSWRGDLALAAAAALAAGFGGPLFYLVRLRRKRQDAFGAQFPDAVDVIVRSLRAGHPVPVAIGMVGREMADPVGSEFGLVADEITYGSDMETALRSMMQRVGQEDLPLFVTSVAIQASTGGNLSQILDNLSKVIRERFKMRRKIRGLSAEGRAGAMILNLTPVAVFLLVSSISPEFYGEIMHLPMTKYVLGGALFWMFIGNMIMRKMINFKI